MKEIAMIFAVIVVVTVGWVALKLAPWSAPISGCVGITVGLVGFGGGNLTVALFGCGLFAFSALLFIVGGGMENR